MDGIVPLVVVVVESEVRDAPVEDFVIFLAMAVVVLVVVLGVSRCVYRYVMVCKAVMVSEPVVFVFVGAGGEQARESYCRRQKLLLYRPNELGKWQL